MCIRQQVIYKKPSLKFATDNVEAPLEVSIAVSIRHAPEKLVAGVWRRRDQLVRKDRFNLNVHCRSKDNSFATQ